MSTVIQVENLSKQYRLGVVGSGTLSHDLNRWWCRMRGLPDPYLKVTESNDRAHKGKSEFVWALKDINFEVKQGEVLGIIGANGAGKSTLLKILSRVTAPTTGEIKVKGRIASLLEVGTGFHPELTGRDNIYLNGAILGMSKAEIAGKFDEIVEFSGCERYIDTPVKRYSSGMLVRLGFAVAAHLEPEILIVDEVLAVGDAEFQKKCLGKMEDVAGHNRTILFVSHNMASMKRLCGRGMLLENGGIKEEGDVDTVVKHYLSKNNSARAYFHFAEEQHRTKSPLQIESVRFVLHGERSVFLFGEPITLDLSIQCRETIRGARIGIGIVSEGARIATVHSLPLDFKGSRAAQTLRCTIPGNVLLPGNFSVVVGAHQASSGQGLDYVNFEIPLQVHEVPASGADSHDVKALGLVRLRAEWQLLSQPAVTEVAELPG